MATKLKHTFTTIRNVDLDNGNDSNNGTTAALAWRTLGKVVTSLFPGASGSSDPISVLVIVAGTSGGSNATSTGSDQFTYDNIASGRTGATEIGIRNWTPADGARPTGAAITRPLLRADNALAITGAAAWVNVTGTLYKSGGTVVTTPTAMSCVLYKPGVLGQLDADGCWKCHLSLTTGTGGDAAATAACTTAWTAYYDTSTKILYINNGTGSPTTADYGWCASQSVENFAKIKPIGFTYVGVEGIDTLYGERGLPNFDSNVFECYDCRFTEHKVHGLICSYSVLPLRNINVENCEVHGLGFSATGSSMLAASGQSGNFDMSGVVFKNCKVRRYMLQNPAGARYTAAQYSIRMIGAGTSAAGTSGFVRDCLFQGCTLEDISSAKTSTVRGEPWELTRCALPADPTSFSAYPVRLDRCVINTFGTWLYQSETANQGSQAVALNNCDVLCQSPDTTLYTYGVRTAMVFGEPIDAAPVTSIMGVFGSTQFVWDIGLGDSANVFTVFGPKNLGSANLGLRSGFYARNSSVSMVFKASGGNAPVMFEQNNDTDAADKDLLIDVRYSKLSAIFPAGQTQFAKLCGRDTPASGNTSRVFLNNEYIGFNQAAFTTANATYANFVTNVDPAANLSPTDPYIKPNYAPPSPTGKRQVIVVGSP